MLNGYHILTLTHHHTPLELIGRVALCDEAPEHRLRTLQRHFGWEELLYLTTCNRVLFLFYTAPGQPVSPETAAEVLAQLHPEFSSETIDAVAPKMRLLHGADAVRHLLEVAASMDSLVVGEREIIRQLRETFERCRRWGLTGDHLRLLLRFTIETAKEVYTATGIGEKALSVVALAFRQMMGTGLPPEARVLLIGAGQTNALVAKFLHKYGYHNVTVFNRTLAKAQALAESLDGNALPLEQLIDFQEGFDAMIVCTGAPEAIITPELYARLLGDDSAPKVVVDLAVPNNVHPEVPRRFALHYLEIEGLRELARENLAHREQERRKADQLLNVKIREYRELWHQRQVERALLPVVDDVRAAKERAVQEVFAHEFTRLSPEAQDLALRMLGYLEKKSVAASMRTMKEIAGRAARRQDVEVG